MSFQRQLAHNSLAYRTKFSVSTTPGSLTSMESVEAQECSRIRETEESDRAGFSS